MLSYDDEKNSLADALDKYSVGVPPVQWLPWIPQLLACLVQYEGNVILNLLSHVSFTYRFIFIYSVRHMLVHYNTSFNLVQPLGTTFLTSKYDF